MYFRLERSIEQILHKVGDDSEEDNSAARPKETRRAWQLCTKSFSPSVGARAGYCQIVISCNRRKNKRITRGGRTRTDRVSTVQRWRTPRIALESSQPPCEAHGTPHQNN